MSRKPIARFLILATIGAVLAGFDGSRRGFSMADAAPTAAKTGTLTPGGAQAAPHELVVSDFHQLVQDKAAQVVDARLRSDFDAGHIPGAISLAFGDFQSGEPAVLASLDRSRRTIVYCEGGDCTASEEVASMLRMYGFADVQVFHAGFPAWKQAGFEVEKD